MTNFVKKGDILSQCEQVFSPTWLCLQKKKGDDKLPSPFPLACTLPQVLAENLLLLQRHVLSGGRVGRSAYRGALGERCRCSQNCDRRVEPDNRIRIGAVVFAAS